MANLIIQHPEQGEETHELLEDVVTIGRVPDNTIQIDHSSVSSSHAEIRKEGESFTLVDLDSTNGTRANGQSVSEHELGNGDSIQFGQVQAQFTSDQPSEAKPLPEATPTKAEVASESSAPADFSSVSPFATKTRERDPIGKTAILLAILGMLAFAGAVASVAMLQPPA